jgi:hypothetical protein
VGGLLLEQTGAGRQGGSPGLGLQDGAKNKERRQAGGRQAGRAASQAPGRAGRGPGLGQTERNGPSFKSGAAGAGRKYDR